MPSISIIIPAYNMRHALARCLASVAAQTLKPSEIIIVDDGSVDGTRDSIGRMQDAYLIPITFIFQNHAGASAARNRGFAASQGDYVMFLDADVVLKKNVIERLYEALSQKSKVKSQKFGIGYSYSSFKWGWKKFSSFPFDAERLKRMPYIHTTSLIRREALPEKPFDESLKRLQDWDLYLTLFERGYEGVYISDVLFTIETSGTMSKWLPSIAYRLPLSRWGVRIPQLEKYREAERKVREKHALK